MQGQRRRTNSSDLHPLALQGPKFDVKLAQLGNRQEPERFPCDARLRDEGVDASEELARRLPLDCLADKPIQKRTAGQAGSFLADSCPQHFPADGAWQHHLSGGAYRPADIAQRTTGTDGKSIF